MKVKDLIAQLQKFDLDTEVCVDNCDITCLIEEPAYWDGSLQVLERDKHGRPISGKYVRSGNKISINYRPFSEIFWDYHDFKIDYSALSPERKKQCEENHQKIIKAAKDLDYEMELEHFIKYVNDKANKIMELEEKLDTKAKDFFDKNLSPYDPFPEDLKDPSNSYNNRRELYWDRIVNIQYTGYGFDIRKT